jgi:hypothetical protein
MKHIQMDQNDSILNLETHVLSTLDLKSLIPQNDNSVDLEDFIRSRHF